MIQNAYDYKPAGGSQPKQVVLLLHGWGSNGQDLISLAPRWARNLPDAVFISPDAPFPCDMGYGYQWFSLNDRNPQTLMRGAEEVRHILDRFIGEQLEKYAVPASKLALVGFSQGTMTSLYVGPRYIAPIAGILGYSGAFIGGIGGAIHKIPVHLIHGDADEVVPITAYHSARDILEREGFTVTGGVTQGLAHSIDQAGLNEGAEFLKKILL